MNFLCLAIIRIILEINFSRRVYTKLYIYFSEYPFYMTYSMSVSVSDKFSLYTLMYFVLIFDIFISNSDPSGIDLLTTIVAFFLFRFLHIHLNWPHLFDQLPYMTNLIRQTQLP